MGKVILQLQNKDFSEENSEISVSNYQNDISDIMNNGASNSYPKDRLNQILNN